MSKFNKLYLENLLAKLYIRKYLIIETLNNKHIESS